MVSMQLFWYTSHSFNVPSQDPKKTDKTVGWQVRAPNRSVS
jgi:hypothetical protein